MATNQPDFAHQEEDITHRFDDSLRKTAYGGRQYHLPTSLQHSRSSNSIRPNFFPASVESSTKKFPPGDSIPLHRLVAETDSRSSRNRCLSNTSESPTLFVSSEDHRYPTLESRTRCISTSSSDSRQLLAPNPFASATTLVPPTAPTSHGLIPYEYDPVADSLLSDDEEDMLHDPKYSDEETRRALKLPSVMFSWRGCANVSTLVLLVAGILFAFMVYPIWKAVERNAKKNAVANSSTGQNISRTAIDEDTPDDAKTRIGFDGQKYDLVYSDEFNEPGRTFYPGDDPYLEAMDFWYGVTGDMEWYDPQQVTTRDGALVITMDVNTTAEAGLTPGSSAPFKAEDNHGLAYRSGMVQSWNKFCFTSGYIEVSVILPGPNSSQVGYWPGAWTMGNLGRPGYRATTDGMWPYSYDECDVGTFINQTEKGNSGPPAALHAEKSWVEYDKRLSVLNGQRLSACTCPNSDHPGPYGQLESGSDEQRYRGRGVPEIDIIEIQHNDAGPGTVASQSAQFAPFTHDYAFDMAGYTIFDTNKTHLNGYQGSPLQQAVSGLTQVPDEGFQGVSDRRFVKYGFEYWADPNSRDDGYITWQVDDKESVRLTPKAVGPDKGSEGSQVGQRIIPEEPMSIVLNLGISQNWGNIDLSTLIFPAEMLFDYIRVYQREGHTNIGCDPKDYPTMDYIRRHVDQYSDWDTKMEWEYERPKNKLVSSD
ncbi:hypothetical protein V5O48_011270 [Marasmius crinis-equi]|uniref:GH16 domain-containing protein n=1 Tax=Marasmius crinis-equi TaxID=585013 RepID=A0ABR3F673_9AGAR